MLVHKNESKINRNQRVNMSSDKLRFKDLAYPSNNPMNITRITPICLSYVNISPNTRQLGVRFTIVITLQSKSLTDTFWTTFFTKKIILELNKCQPRCTEPIYGSCKFIWCFRYQGEGRIVPILQRFVFKFGAHRIRRGCRSTRG